MTTTAATLGERALRRLGVAIVPVADRPDLTVTVTPDSIATSALVELGVIAADEQPTPSDQALALSKTRQVHDSLVAQAFVRWGIDAIPQSVAEEYIKLVANTMGTSFGKAGDIQVYTLLEQRVRRVSMIMQAVDEAARAVVAVHQDLAARGLARWSIFDVPPAVEQPYVMLAANLLAPGFEKQANPQEAMMAMAELVKYGALPTSGERTFAEYY